MASTELSRRVEKIVGYPPLRDMDADQRREFHEALLDADSFEDLPGKWQAAILKGGAEPAEPARGQRRLYVQWRRPRTRRIACFGPLKLAEVDEDRVAELIADMQRDGKAASTIRNTLAPLSRIMNVAARRGLVAGNPITGLDRSERPRNAGKAPKRILDRKEIGRLLGSAGSHRLLLSAALNTGLRQSELLGLLWSNIDFANGAIYVTGQLDRGRKEQGVWIKQHRVEYAKSDAGYRMVELIPSDLFKALREHKLASSYSKEEDFVFVTSAGTPIDHKDASTRGLAKAKDRAGLNVIGKPNLRFHDLRHTYASATIAAGVDPVYLSRQLGHNDPSVTLDIYADLFEAREKAEESRSRLEASGYKGLV